MKIATVLTLNFNNFFNFQRNQLKIGHVIVRWQCICMHA